MNSVEIVMHDLADAHDQLKNSKHSPKVFRRSFANFVELSQKLTSMMRTDFPEKGKWKALALEFSGWNKCTEIIKELRNYDQHEDIIRTEVEVIKYHTVPAEDGCPEMTFGMKYTQEINPLSDSPPTDDLKLMAADPKTGRITNIEIGFTKELNYTFYLNISNDSDRGRKINRLLKQTNDPDIIQLASKSHSVLKDYYSFYKSKTSKISQN